ncbi:hypothetical protein [Candidatus Binatus sp.]|uniref:hypothetical protein n=1 Tax=Candidatus Binatus sp. TaxID=2811406 RepID=UPI002F92F81A
MSYASNAAASTVLTRWRRFNLLLISFVAWGLVALNVYGVIHAARVRSWCPAPSRSWSNYGFLFSAALVAVPFLYLRWVRGWYQRHPPIAWFSAPWWRRAGRRSLIIALIFIVPFVSGEIVVHLIGGSLSAKLADNFVETDSTVQKFRPHRQFGGSFTYQSGAWHVSYKFRVSTGQPGDLIIVHLDRKGAQWSVCCWELESHSHVSFFTVADDKSVEVASPAAKLAEDFVQTDSAIQTLRAQPQFRPGGESFDYTRVNTWDANYKFWLSGEPPEDSITINLKRRGTRWRVFGWVLDSHSHLTFFRVVDNKSVPVACW